MLLSINSAFKDVQVLHASQMVELCADGPTPSQSGRCSLIYNKNFQFHIHVPLGFYMQSVNGQLGTSTAK